MKKRSFKQQVKYAEKAILEEDKERHEKFMCAQFSECNKREQRHKRKKLWVSFSSVLAVVFVAVIGVVITLPVSEDEREKNTYFAENITAVTIELSEVLENLDGVKISIGENYESSVERVYDLVSGDVLFYRIRYRDYEIEYENVIIEFYVNPDYENTKILNDEPETYLMNGKLLNYNLFITDDDWAYIINYRCVMKNENWEMYIDYEQFSEDEQSNFFAFLEQSVEII